MDLNAKVEAVEVKQNDSKTDHKKNESAGFGVYPFLRDHCLYCREMPWPDCCGLHRSSSYWKIEEVSRNSSYSRFDCPHCREMSPPDCCDQHVSISYWVIKEVNTSCFTYFIFT